MRLHQFQNIKYLYLAPRLRRLRQKKERIIFFSTYYSFLNSETGLKLSSQTYFCLDITRFQPDKYVIISNKRPSYPPASPHMSENRTSILSFNLILFTKHCIKYRKHGKHDTVVPMGKTQQSAKSKIKAFTMLICEC